MDLWQTDEVGETVAPGGSPVFHGPPFAPESRCAPSAHRECARNAREGGDERRWEPVSNERPTAIGL